MEEDVKMDTIGERCTSCGVLFTQHPGLIKTCNELQEALDEIKRLKDEVRILNLTCKGFLWDKLCEGT